MGLSRPPAAPAEGRFEEGLARMPASSCRDAASGRRAPEPPAAAGGATAGRARAVVGLDLLRFAAASLVMLFHLACTQWLVPSSEAGALLARPIAFPGLLPLSAVGWIGVQIFFVISGFVIAYSAAGTTARRFLESRALRLLPCAWFCASVSAALALAYAPEGAPELMARYLRTLVLFPVPRWIDGVYWTLGIEISFYALVYGLLAAGRFDRLEAVLTAVGLGSAATWCLAALGPWPGLEVLANSRIAKLCLVTHGCDFALGVVISAAAAVGWTGRRFLAAAACTAGALLQIGYDDRFNAHALGLDGAVPVLSPRVLFLCFLVLLVLAVHGNGRLTRAIGRACPAVRLIGLSTYPLYLLHTFVGALTMRAMHSLGAGPAICLSAAAAAAVASALLVAWRIEPRLRTGLRRCIHRRDGSGRALTRDAAGTLT